MNQTAVEYLRKFVLLPC